MHTGSRRLAVESSHLQGVVVVRMLEEEVKEMVKVVVET